MATLQKKEGILPISGKKPSSLLTQASEEPPVPGSRKLGDDGWIGGPGRDKRIQAKLVTGAQGQWRGSVVHCGRNHSYMEEPTAVLSQKSADENRFEIPGRP